MKIFKKIICVVFMILTCVISSYAQENYSCNLSTTIEFVINTDNIIQNQNYNYYIDEIIPTIERNKENVESILLIGSASPEGNYHSNLILANKRADKIYSYISKIIPKEKIIKSNDHNLFLQKTGLDEKYYPRLRATYLEVCFIKDNKEIQKDTVYIEKKDTVYNNTNITNNYYFQQKEKAEKPVLGIYNNLLSDLILRPNIGFELYFSKMSFFIEGSFSNWPLFGKTYNIYHWNTGFRKYFNYDYDKWFIGIYGNAGYFDTEIFSNIGKVGIIYGGGIELGYTFSLKYNWSISPIIRIGLFERVYYSDYYINEGNINIVFNTYTDGKTYNPNDIESISVENNKVMINKVISSKFIDNSNKGYYIGPTFVGIVLKKNFLIK